MHSQYLIQTLWSKEMDKLDANNYREYYSWERFRELNPDERQALIEYTVEQVRLQKGLQEVKLQMKSLEPGHRGSCGQRYSFNQFKHHEMLLNNDILTTQNPHASYRTYNTIHHELEHASQYELAANQQIGNDNAAVLEQRLNDENYHRSSAERFGEETDYQLYRAQACEAEARKAGLDAVKELHESNKAKGISDKHAEEYIKYTEAKEIKNNRKMMSCLGMHPRENMAREELQYISESKVNNAEREKVLSYARERDYQTAKTVLQEDSIGKISEEQIQDAFNNNRGYRDYFQTVTYDVLKEREGERNKISRYKWENDHASNDNQTKRNAYSSVMKSTRERSDMSTGNKREIFRTTLHDKKSSATDVQAKRANFSKSISDSKHSRELGASANRSNAKGAESVSSQHPSAQTHTKSAENKVGT